MNGDGPLVRLEGVHKWFSEELHVLRGIDLSVSPGEVVVVIGPSGSGKSTLLRTINVLEEPTEGRVLFDGVDLTDIRTDLDAARTGIGLVFQQFNLFPHKTALGNITLALRSVLPSPGSRLVNGPSSSSRRSDSTTRRTRTRASSPEGSSSESRSRALSRCGRS